MYSKVQQKVTNKNNAVEQQIYCHVIESYLTLITPGDKDISNKCSSPTSVEVDISVQKLIWNQTKVFNMPTEASREYYLLYK